MGSKKCLDCNFFGVDKMLWNYKPIQFLLSAEIHYIVKWLDFILKIDHKILRKKYGLAGFS